ncbi:enoyl-CoA hydratase/isomerase family protein [Fertoebacter nigrum]|uniref:3-hydroxyisobutyryl-CoA hydrolase n=1 Tax=Fertoeibacter niger TaxID=2656921 RepID=A0A8X8KMV1_9RHOB|nr:enoyl-CoA hydratase/isomerase family protein [Fertoeibacter niger]NUB43101.1 enoyl-CoA hydratase/isomerase family protein [Fertoeibacter niger]
MSDVLIRREGHAGRITLNRPEALNALSYPMCMAIDAALQGWRDDAQVRLIVIDAIGDRAFCAGGDIAELYARGTAGDHAHGQAFWRDEYRMNARIAAYPKPVVALMQGFTMGGGVGLGCHASHRIVGETSQIALPECGIGLVPDVGSSALLARAPGKLGSYLGVTGARMGPGDALHAGFADAFVPQADWPALTASLISGAITIPPHLAAEAPLATLRPLIDRHFAAPSLAAITDSLRADASPFAADTLHQIARISPLAGACTIAIQRLLGPAPTLRAALELEYRFTHRAQAQGDFLEGIRAAIIDRDRNPRWAHSGPAPEAEIARMLAPLGPDTLTFPGDIA